MADYISNMEVTVVPRERRAEPDAHLTAEECRLLRRLNGELQWAQSQLRLDISFGTSTSQGALADPRVRHLVAAGDLVRQLKANRDWELRFQSLSLSHGGFVGVSDAGLGNVTRGGATGSLEQGDVHSQGGHLVLFADDSLSRGGEAGRFNVLDWRSRRLKRVCRSSFAAETLALADCNDAMQHMRGLLLDIMTPRLRSEDWEAGVSRWPAMLVTDARDCHDHLQRETMATPQQRTLLFDLASIRETLDSGSTTLRWTATENMLVDAFTKRMDSSHLLNIVSDGMWSVIYDERFVNKEIAKHRRKQKPRTEPVENEK